MIENEPILIASPHPDDEILGASSFFGENSENVTVFYHTEDHQTRDIEIMREESNRLAEHLRFNKRVSTIDRLAQLDDEPLLHLICEYEELIREIAPGTLIVPHPSYNQDHRAVYEAALTAVRPHDEIPFVSRVLVYEGPGCFGILRNGPAFKPQYFREIDIDRKLFLYSFYQSQMRGHRSPDKVKVIAQLRGIQCGYKYAEGFEILRWRE